LERRAEDQRVTAYNAYSALLNKDLNKYNSDIANLTAEIASLQDRIDATNASKDDNLDRLNAKTQQRDDRRAECQEAAYDYQQRRSARDSDRQTVSDLIGHLNSNMRDLKEYIALRVAAGDTNLSE
jgi:chromosome segregation ATPase